MEIMAKKLKRRANPPERKPTRATKRKAPKKPPTKKKTGKKKTVKRKGPKKRPPTVSPKKKKGRPGRPTTRSKKDQDLSQRDTAARSSRDRSKAGRDIAPIDFSVINWDRRLACEKDLELFGLTYLPSVFYLSISEDHKAVIRKLETVFLEGGMFALAMPRGQGKTAWCRAATIWGTAYAHITFPFFVGSQQDKALQTLEFIKTYWYRSQELREDFPEIAAPIVKLENRFHLARGQTYNGEPTHIEYGADTVRYPCLILDKETVAPYLKHSPGLVRHLPNLGGYMLRSAGCVIRTSGIEGSIRGEAEIHPLTLEQPRPDAVLLDDIQKDQKAESPASCEKLIRLIDGAVQGLSGPDQLIASIMPCTVIRQEDVSDTYLDRTKKPEWKGERCSMVTNWPEGITNDAITMDTEAGIAWNTYADLRRESLQQSEDIHTATEFYEANREIMDDGFFVSWVDRYNGNPDYKGNREVSAQQHAMNLRLQNPETFLAEYQNTPASRDANAAPIITPGQLAEKTIALERGTIPADSHHTVAFIDPQNEVMFWLVMATSLDYTGAIIDYGTWPPVSTRYFTKGQTEGWSLLTREFFKAYPEHMGKATKTAGGKIRAPFEAKIYFGLTQTAKYLLGRKFPEQSEHGTYKQLERLGIDTRWGKASDTIKRFCRDYGRQEIIPCYGQGVGPAYKQYEEYKRTKGWLFEDNVNPRVKEVRWIYKPSPDGLYHLNTDVNRLKTFLMHRLASPLGSPGSIALFDAPPLAHEVVADHIAGSEYPEPVTARGITKDQWKVRDGRPDNDLLDCSVGCLALLSMLGVCLTSPDVPNVPRRTRRRLSELWRARHNVR